MLSSKSLLVMEDGQLGLRPGRELPPVQRPKNQVEHWRPLTAVLQLLSPQVFGMDVYQDHSITAANDTIICSRVLRSQADLGKSY